MQPTTRLRKLEAMTTSDVIHASTNDVHVCHAQQGQQRLLLCSLFKRLPLPANLARRSAKQCIRQPRVIETKGPQWYVENLIGHPNVRTLMIYASQFGGEAIGLDLRTWSRSQSVQHCAMSCHHILAYGDITVDAVGQSLHARWPISLLEHGSSLGEVIPCSSDVGRRIHVLDLSIGHS